MYLYCSVLASAKIAVTDSGNGTEKGPAGRPLCTDCKLTSELKTQEKYKTEEEWLVFAKCFGLFPTRCVHV